MRLLQDNEDTLRGPARMSLGTRDPPLFFCPSGHVLCFPVQLFMAVQIVQLFMGGADCTIVHGLWRSYNCSWALQIVQLSWAVQIEQLFMGCADCTIVHGCADCTIFHGCADCTIVHCCADCTIVMGCADCMTRLAVPLSTVLYFTVTVKCLDLEAEERQKFLYTTQTAARIQIV